MNKKFSYYRNKFYSNNTSCGCIFLDIVRDYDKDVFDNEYNKLFGKKIKVWVNKIKNNTNGNNRNGNNNNNFSGNNRNGNNFSGNNRNGYNNNSRIFIPSKFSARKFYNNNQKQSNSRNYDDDDKSSENEDDDDDSRNYNEDKSSSEEDKSSSEEDNRYAAIQKELEIAIAGKKSCERDLLYFENKYEAIKIENQKIKIECEYQKEELTNALQQITELKKKNEQLHSKLSKAYQ